jgi:hypothetical protein
MPRLATLLAPLARPSWLGVLLSCLLSLTGPSDLSVVAALVGGDDGPVPGRACVSANEEDADREEDLLRPSASQDGRRFERKLARVAVDLPEGPALALALTSPGPRPHLAGSEHAGRNGVGAPLLC